MFGYSSVIILFAALTARNAAALKRTVPERSDIEAALTFLKPYQLIGARFFHIEKDVKLDWFSASRSCQQIGGKLATIRDEYELELIVPKLKWDSAYWLSLNDLAHEGVFTSVSGQPAPFLNWRQGQPDNYDFEEHCVKSINLYIYDTSCYEKNYFICELGYKKNTSKG